jgi:hypothetical protein
MSPGEQNKNITGSETLNGPSKSAEKEAVKSQSQKYRRELQYETSNKLTIEEEKVILDTNKFQKEIMDRAVQGIKDKFKGIYNLRENRGKNSLQTLVLGFLSELEQIDKSMTEKRKLVAKDASLSFEERVDKIKNETLTEMNTEILNLSEFAEYFAEDIRKNGGKNSLEALLKAEDELSLYLDLINEDEDIRQALAFAYDFSFDEESRDDKKDKIFTMLASKIVDRPDQLRAWSLIVRKLGISEINDFRDNYFAENKAKLIELIALDKNEYASIIFISLYGEAEFLAVSGLDESEKETLIKANRAISDYQDKAERLKKTSIGARNAALDMMSGENLLGVFGLLWGVTTTGLNLFVELGGGKFKKDPSKALNSAIKNPYVWGGAVAGGMGLSILTDGLDSLNPEDEKIAEEKQEASNRMKNLLLSDTHPLNKLINTNSAIFALSSFGRNKLKVDELKSVSDIKNPEQVLTKRYFMEYLNVLINETDENTEDQKELMALRDYMKNIPYDNEAFSELVVNLLTLDIGGSDIESANENYKAYIETLQ